jgi:4-hydroxy-tetrahydrodipicolinate reductase
LSARRLLVLGRGKTGSLVTEVARQRAHQVEVLGSTDNAGAAQLTPEKLAVIDVVIDFTTPHAVLANIDACLRARKPMVVGTTGWYGERERVRAAVEQAGTGFVFGANFSYGVNLFFQIAQAAAPALAHGYQAHITETHHVHKKDAPSGTAAALRNLLAHAGGEVEITSIREGDVPGTHTIEFTSGSDRIVLTHEAKSRRAFAEGAVMAAEWIVDKQGFYDFKDIFRRL